jgi:DNA repair protein RecN (Recombination protein N)
VLTKIYIKNFAIISELELHCQAGLIALTGETGAGKSIILGAIDLLLGARADSNSLYNKNEKCIIEAYFSNQNNELIKHFLVTNQIDEHPEIIIRREIQSNGRSRAFINDTPVVLQQLTELGDLLIDLHRQFDTLDVKNADYQLQVIDTIGDHQTEIKNYTNQYKKYKQASAHLQQLQQEHLQLKKEFDYHSFLYAELENLNIKPNEIEAAEDEMAILSNAEELKLHVASVNQIMQHADNAIVIELKNAIQTLQHHASKIKKIQPIVDRLNTSLIELKDIAEELNDLEDGIEVDQEKLMQLTERYNEGTRLLKKHNLETSDDLIGLQTDLSEKLMKVNDGDEQIKEATKNVIEQEKELKILAQALSNKRKIAAIAATGQVNGLLPKVGMPNAQMQIEVAEIPCSANGADKINFLFDANKTNKFLPIAKAASGGELSRLMLCIKSLLAKATAIGTLVFDEIDTGISGEVAKQVALILQDLSKHYQIITVTHLPQIAAKAQHHLYVYKTAEADGVIRTQVKQLSKEERINHIAEMLSGSAPTSTALQTAEELMKA